MSRQYAWAPRSQRVYGDVSGNRRNRTNLIMAQRGKEWLAPRVFGFSCCAALVEKWLETMLIPKLLRPSVVVMDNASFHNKRNIKNLLEEHGHKLLPLPPYSPDLNPIEQTFAILKKRREYAQPQMTLEELLMSKFGFD